MATSPQHDRLILTGRKQNPVKHHQSYYLHHDTWIIAREAGFTLDMETITVLYINGIKDSFTTSKPSSFKGGSCPDNITWRFKLLLIANKFTSSTMIDFVLKSSAGNYLLFKFCNFQGSEAFAL